VELLIGAGVIAATLRLATPIAFAALGGVITERSGVTNIALEGCMLFGAFFGILAADKTGSAPLAVLIGLLAGIVLAAVHAVASVTWRADQIVTGMALNILALGVTSYLNYEIYGSGVPSGVPLLPALNLDFLAAVPFVGGVIGHQNVLVWLALVLVIVLQLYMFRTVAGLRLRAVGEHPRAADTVGISVYKTRYAAVIVSGMLSALGGAYLSIGFLGSFNENMTAGRGFIGLAALIFGNWRPFGAFAAALLFGFSTALSFRLADPSVWPSQAVLFQALPYVLTLIAVAGVIGRSIPPAASGRPYRKQ